MHSWLFRGARVSHFWRDNGGFQQAEQGVASMERNFKFECCLKNHGKKTPKNSRASMPSADIHHFAHADLSGFPATHQQPTS